MKFIKWFSDISLKDVSIVGGKNASTGQMISNLSPKGVKVPNGFAITAQAYWYFLKKNNIINELQSIINQLSDYNDLDKLANVSKKIRKLIEEKPIPKDLAQEIVEAYEKLSLDYAPDFAKPFDLRSGVNATGRRDVRRKNDEKKYCSVAVRSSATAEDLPNASFAGQQESFLNINNPKSLLINYKKCLSSLFTKRAIVYREENNFDHFKVGLSVGVQKMIRSDLASSGVAFTLDTETGFKDVVFINSSYGLGEAIVQGIVDPDGFYVHKPTLEQGFKPILKKSLGTKKIKIVYSQNKTKKVSVSTKEQNQFSLTQEEILHLSKMCLIIEKHYSELNNKWTPMDIEWAKDGLDKQIYIVQARYETIHAKQLKKEVLAQYILNESDENKLKKLLIITGQSIGQKIVSGRAKILKNSKQIKLLQQGDILVTTMTDPDWVPIMKKASAIITDNGGRTCHAAIVSRELGIPAVIGTELATKKIKDGQQITIDCSQGEIAKVYEGELKFSLKETKISSLKKPPIKLLINSAIPEQAFAQSFLPVDGVGLARIEFIITDSIKIHPMAFVDFEKIKDVKTKKQIAKIIDPYRHDKKKYFIDKLAQEAGTIAAAFYPRPVILRFSDFKSNEYANLIAGKYFEPKEENPMIGLRGASRYYNDLYQKAFALECFAMKKIRNEMGLKNVKLMVPFVRTIQEAQKVLNLMKKYGLEQNKDGLEIIMMCEVPSNVILIDEFCKYFDGFSIGSNDLTQLTLAIDRDSELLSDLFDEKNEAVKRMMLMAIKGAHAKHKPIGICGQAPSDYPEIAEFLIKNGIDSISLNPDSIIPFLTRKK